MFVGHNSVLTGKLFYNSVYFLKLKRITVLALYRITKIFLNFIVVSSLYQKDRDSGLYIECCGDSKSELREATVAIVYVIRAKPLIQLTN